MFVHQASKYGHDILVVTSEIAKRVVAHVEILLAVVKRGGVVVDSQSPMWCTGSGSQPNLVVNLQRFFGNRYNFCLCVFFLLC